MLHRCRWIGATDIRESMCAALGANEEAVALGVVAGVLSACTHPHKAAVAVLAHSGRYSLAHDAALCASAKVDHLGAGIGLLMIVGDSYGVEFR